MRVYTFINKNNVFSTMAVFKKQKKEGIKQEPVERKKLTSNQQIKELEDQIANTKYNKATEKAIGLLKAKLAKLKEKQIQHASKSSGKGTGYSVRKTGDGTAVLLGFPSVGKSTILNAITDAHSEVGAYEFTTLDVVPGILEINHAKIQILDVPGIERGAATGRGRGTEVLAVLRSADLAVIIIDATRPEHYEAVLSEINDAGIRINQQKPDVRITKKPKGGIRIASTLKLDVSKETIELVLREMRINNADVII